jgi:hypothetical protein
MGTSIRVISIKSRLNRFCRVSRNAKWRKDPATEAQKNFVRKKWLNKKKGQGIISEENIEKITKGEAGNMITRLKHGAKVGAFCFRSCLPYFS